MFKVITNSVIIQFVLMLLVVDVLAMGIATAQSRHNNIMPYWKNKAAPIKVSGITADGKYPIYDIEGEATDITYKAGNTLYTSGDLVGKLIFIDPADTKVYHCEFLCKDKQNHTVGINPSFKFLTK